MIEKKLHLIKTSEILVPENRQRKEISETELENLSDSILRHGLLHPIVLKRDHTLVVGERRLKAWQRLEKMPLGEDHHEGIPSVFTDELNENQLRAIELEENIQRSDLCWQDEACAFLDYYEVASVLWADEENAAAFEEAEENEAVLRIDPDEYSFATMSGELNCSDRHCRRMVQVGRAIRLDDDKVKACDSARAAGALIERRARRVAENELVKFGEAEKKTPTVSVGDLSLDALDLMAPTAQEETAEVAPIYKVERVPFEDWMECYSGERFNFIHCDFPYSIGLDKSDLYKTKTRDLDYEDAEEIYWDLCQALVYAQDTVLSQTCHIVFWFPMSKYTATVEHFRTHGFWVDPYPLFWMKSDKMGILPDPTRGGRRIYETALVMSLGDRKVVTPTVNAGHYPSDSKDKEHASQKSQVMLEDFFRMFVDEDSIVLDPTCGSGTALAAAIKLGAQFVQGLDINEECVRVASDMARNAYALAIKGND